MTSVDVNTNSEATTEVAAVDMKLEVVVLGVSDVDRAKAFYEKLGWRLDIDVAAGDFRGVPAGGIAVLELPADAALEPGIAKLAAFWWP